MITVIQGLLLFVIASCYSLVYAAADIETDVSMPEISTTYVFNGVLDLWRQFQQGLPLLALGLIILLISYFLSRPLSKLMIKPFSYISSSQLIQLVMRRVFSLLIIMFGLYTFLRLAGLTQFAVAIISGTGVLGLIIGFAFKDIAENFISSLLLSVQKPFKLNDVIEVEGQLGVVKQVTARATTLVDFDGNHIQIPNSTIYKNIIRNITANPKIRGKFVIGVGYDSSIVLAQELAMKIMRSTEAVLDEPEPQVLIDELGSSSVVLKLYYWVDGHEHSLMKVSSKLMRLTMREFENNGISMPDDARELIFPQGIEVKHSSPQSTSESSQKDSSSVTSEVAPKAAEPEDEESQKAIARDMDKDAGEEDLTSDTESIRQQANEAPSPESGDNIL